MSDHRWRVLLVEDDEEDYLLTREMLSVSREFTYKLEWTPDYNQARDKILTNSYDAILMDYALGIHSGLDLIRDVTEQGCKSPIILLTGRGNIDIDLQAMEVGATDYLLKDEATPSLLERAIRYAILNKQNEEALLNAKAELETRVEERTRELIAQNATLEAEINERMRVEAELAEMQRRLIDRNEVERLELARDIHDGPMQDLYGLIFQIDALTVDFTGGQDEVAAQTIKERLLQVIQSLRVMSRELRPPALAPYGLEKAIRSHAENIRQVHPDLQINLDLDEDGLALPEHVRLALFRIYQVAITNVIRHSKATKVEIYLTLDPIYIRMVVGDNGCGFEVPLRWIEFARQGHLGLVGAVERAEAVGGHLEVESASNGGTQIRVIVPRNGRMPATAG